LKAILSKIRPDSARAVAAAKASRAAKCGEKPVSRLKTQLATPMTLGNSAAANVRFIISRWDCGHQIEPDPTEVARRYVPTMSASTGRRGSV